MSTYVWKTAYSSVIGSSHLKTNTPCQDASLCCVVKNKKGEDIFLAIASDGAGSACRSDVSSQLTVDFLINEFCYALEAGNIINLNTIQESLEQLRQKIAKIAELENLPYREFACTVLGSIISNEEAIFFQIGDGAIVVSEDGNDEYQYIFWPQHGEFANQTNFLIQNSFLKKLNFLSSDRKYNKVALFTDGIERLILNFTSKTVHRPALQSIFDWLENVEPEQKKFPSDVLTSYLGSDFINHRTNDDKTLIMATRHTIDNIKYSQNSL